MLYDLYQLDLASHTHLIWPTKFFLYEAKTVFLQSKAPLHSSFTGSLLCQYAASLFSIKGIKPAWAGLCWTSFKPSLELVLKVRRLHLDISAAFGGKGVKFGWHLCTMVIRWFQYVSDYCYIVTTLEKWRNLQWTTTMCKWLEDGSRRSFLVTQPSQSCVTIFNRTPVFLQPYSRHAHSNGLWVSPPASHHPHAHWMITEAFLGQLF